MRYGDATIELPSDPDTSPEGFRKCNNCKEVKPLDSEHFSADERYSKGFTRLCRTCLADSQRGRTSQKKTLSEKADSFTAPEVLPAYRKMEFPSDEKILEAFKEFKNIEEVATSIGCVGGTLRTYLRTKPKLYEECRNYLSKKTVSKWTPEEKARRDKAAKRKWAANNPEKVKAYNRKWAAGRDKETVRKWNRYNQQRRANSLAAFDMTDEEINLSYMYEEIIVMDPCSYCGKEPKNTIDHIQAIFSGGSDKWENKTGACLSCNSSKREKDVLQFMLWRKERANA